MNQTATIDSIKEIVKSELSTAEAGHDWLHVERVYQNALDITQELPNVDIFVVELAALLHDIADAKFHGGNENIGVEKASEIMQKFGVTESTMKHVMEIIANMSFRKMFDKLTFDSLELHVVRDADRLDAIGAIGIARTFSYGAYKNNKFYNESVGFKSGMTKDQYVSSDSNTVQHFYDKLLKLKDLMHTLPAKRMAEKRHDFLIEYLDHLGDEIGKDFVSHL
jgi:uncharacterized protein